MIFNFKLLKELEWYRSCQEETLWLMKPFPEYFLFSLGISFMLLASCFVLDDLKCVFEVIIAQYPDVLWYHIESKKISTKVFPKFAHILSKRFKSSSLQILQKQKYYLSRSANILLLASNIKYFQTISLPWERFWLLLKQAYTNFKKKIMSKKQKNNLDAALQVSNISQV